MCDKRNDQDNESVHSNESVTSTITALKESLENWIEKYMKDFGVHHDLQLRNSLLKLEEENVSYSCRHLESQIKIRNERVEEFHEKLKNCLKKNCNELEKQLSLVQTNLENVNNLFSTAFEKYSSNFERNVINQGLKEIEEEEKESKRLANEINAMQHREKVTDSLIKSKENERAGIERFINISSELLLNRANIKLEEEYNALTKTIEKLEAKRNNLKSFLKKINL